MKFPPRPDWITDGPHRAPGPHVWHPWSSDSKPVICRLIYTATYYNTICHVWCHPQGLYSHYLYIYMCVCITYLLDVGGQLVPRVVLPDVELHVRVHRSLGACYAKLKKIRVLIQCIHTHTQGLPGKSPATIPAPQRPPPSSPTPDTRTLGHPETRTVDATFAFSDKYYTIYTHTHASVLLQ